MITTSEPIVAPAVRMNESVNQRTKGASVKSRVKLSSVTALGKKSPA